MLFSGSIQRGDGDIKGVEGRGKGRGNGLVNTRVRGGGGGVLRGELII